MGSHKRRMTAALAPDVRHRNLERLVVSVVRSAIDNEGKRLLLVIEDAQFMNQLSMKLLLKVSDKQGTTPRKRVGCASLRNSSAPTSLSQYPSLI